MHIILHILLSTAAHLILRVDNLYNTLWFRFRERCFFLWWLNGLFTCLLLKLCLIQTLNKIGFQLLKHERQGEVRPAKWPIRPVHVLISGSVTRSD